MDNFRKHFFTLIIFCSVFSVNSQSQQDIDLANEYYFAGESEKALELYKKLSRSRDNLSEIHSNYLALLLNEGDYAEARKYLDRAVQNFPSDLQYRVDMLYVLKLSEEEREKHKLQSQLLDTYGQNQYRLNVIAQHLVNKEMLDEAIVFLSRARKVNGNPRAFALDLAGIYRMKNDKEAMANEYLNYAMVNPGNTNYIKNIFQVLLSEDEDLDFLESILIKKVQQQPDQKVYSDLLIWVELQRKNFYGAFVQARALDKRFGKPGDETMDIGRIAMDNDAWKDAIDIYDYVITEFGRNYHYPTAKQMKIKAAENLVKSQYPVDTNEIRKLTAEYQSLYNELGANPITLEALRNKAMLHAFYLGEMDSSINILQSIINTPRVHAELISNCKMSLGDIYLLNGEPWEASLLYSQVEKANKYSVVGYNAKLKNAKLHYYNGNFALAESALGILKRATTKEISNDAIDLGLLINNNTVLDTTDLVMKLFASIELLRYQNKDEEAKSELHRLILENPNHSLIDESYWLLSDLYLKSGQYHESIKYLDLILSDHKNDIWGDDAFFKKAQIHEKQLNEPDVAQELYREFLELFPGSMYVAESRKRFRILRGDFIN